MNIWSLLGGRGGKPRGIVLSKPVLGLANLGSRDDASDSLMAEDEEAIAGRFTAVKRSWGEVPRCDVLFVYGPDADDAESVSEIVLKSRARLVVFACEKSRIPPANPPPRLANASLAFTLRRNGNAFSSFYRRLFGLMSTGMLLADAWGRIAPQVPQATHDGQPVCLLICRGPAVTFR